MLSRSKIGSASAARCGIRLGAPSGRGTHVAALRAQPSIPLIFGAHRPVGVSRPLNKPNHTTVLLDFRCDLLNLIRGTIVVVEKPLALVLQGCSIVSAMRTGSKVVCYPTYVIGLHADIALIIQKTGKEMLSPK